MAPTLREKQKQLARDSILQAAADELVERGMLDFSLQSVASRAGVSTRTLYNYFESKDQLFVELLAWSDRVTQERGAWVEFHHLDGIAEETQKVWRTWEEIGNVYDALAIIESAGPASEAAAALRSGRSERTERLRTLLLERRPDLERDEVDELAVLLHAMIGPALHTRMKELSNFTSERSGPVTAWAIELVVDAISEGRTHRRP